MKQGIAGRPASLAELGIYLPYDQAIRFVAADFERHDLRQ